jgi:hypothetical protein
VVVGKKASILAAAEIAEVDLGGVEGRSAGLVRFHGLRVLGLEDDVVAAVVEPEAGPGTLFGAAIQSRRTLEQ